MIVGLLMTNFKLAMPGNTVLRRDSQGNQAPKWLRRISPATVAGCPAKLFLMAQVSADSNPLHHSCLYLLSLYDALGRLRLDQDNDSYELFIAFHLVLVPNCKH